jgi:DNA-binding SARP family transcriptional activator
VLKYLLCERNRVVPAAQIAAALWPEGDIKALNNVRHFVHAVRECLEPSRAKRAPSSFVVSRTGGYTLDLNRVHIDADQFEHHVRTGVASFMSGEGAVSRESLEEGLDLYGGDFLADEPYADWVVAERDRLRSLAARAYRLLGELALRAGDLDAAIHQVQGLAELEPLDHEVQWALLTLFIRRGKRSEAVRRYGMLRQRMLREFGEEPEFELLEVSESADQPLRLA